MTEAEKFAHVKLRGKFAEGFFAHQRSAQLCKLTLRQFGVVFKDIVGNYDAQNCVAKKFLTLVILNMSSCLIGKGRMGYAHLEKMNIPKCIAEIFFKIM